MGHVKFFFPSIPRIFFRPLDFSGQGRLIRSQILKSKEMILSEAKEMQGFMDLLMRQRNTGSGWTQAEKVQLLHYIARLAVYVPLFFVFLLPGGFVLIPILAETLDRRKHRRHPAEEAVPEETETRPEA